MNEIDYKVQIVDRILYPMWKDLEKEDALNRIEDNPTHVRTVMQSFFDTKRSARAYLKNKYERFSGYMFEQMDKQEEPYKFLFRATYDYRPVQYPFGRRLAIPTMEKNPATGINELTLRIAKDYALRSIFG